MNKIKKEIKPIDLEKMWLRTETLLVEERYKRHIAELELTRLKLTLKI